MSEVPAPVTESTGAELNRVEGRARSFKAIGTINLGELLKWGASGALQMVGTETDNPLFVGVAIQGATSGQRVTTIKGHVQVRWDGAGTVTPGTLLVASTTRSGWFTAGTALSGGMAVGIYSPNPAIGGGFASLPAGQSGLLQPVETIA